MRPARWYYLFACYGVLLCTGILYSRFNPEPTITGDVFSTILLITYPAIYLLPTVLLVWIFERVQTNSATATRLLDTVIVVMTVMTTLLLYSDLKLYDLYGFHINGFVINLLVTPGGIESLGGGLNTFVMAGASVAGILLLHVVLFIAARRVNFRFDHPARIAWIVAGVFIALTLSDRIMFGVSDFRQYAPVLNASVALPLYNRVTFRSLLDTLGLQGVHRSNVRIDGKAKKLKYPLKPLQTTEVKPMNVIWLVSESMRWDMLSPEIMPDTWDQSSKGWFFENHYSGGNGTRQGLFALFYGIYGSYWDSFLLAHRSPVLIDLLRERGYEFQMFTSASFTYPEFDQTLFAALPQSQLHQLSGNIAAWQRDITNTDQIVDFLKERDTDTPFMIFMFYESTHARYHFPEESAIRRPYMEDLNYATMSRDSLASRIDELRNRYINASHFIDGQLQKIYQALDEKALWNDTIVMMTGDHGEEFMENGFWGHNSGFSEHQVRTPMVLWIPGKESRQISGLTSHMDIVPTLLPMMGVTSPTSDYSLGKNLMASDGGEYIVMSDWAGVCYLGDGFKFTLPFSSSLALSNELFDAKDNPVANAVPFLSSHRDVISEVLANAREFAEQ